MILTCPSCATRYFTPDEAVGAAGRMVRCQACGETWRAASDAPLELTAAVADIAPVGEETPRESLAETPGPELPGAFRARAEQQRRLRRAAVHGAVWAGLASLFLGLLGAAWLFRVQVVELVPRAAAAYAAIGAPVNRTGLEFEAISARPTLNDPARVLISGAVRNVRDREIAAPPVRVALLDAQGAEIAHAVVRIDAAPVLPGGVQGFAVILADPGARGVGVGVDFALEAGAGAPAPGPLRPARRLEAPPPPPLDASVQDAADDGLRPVALPVEARPADAESPSPLDSDGSGAVSPGHHG